MRNAKIVHKSYEIDGKMVCLLLTQKMDSYKIVKYLLLVDLYGVNTGQSSGEGGDSDAKREEKMQRAHHFHRSE